MHEFHALAIWSQRASSYVEGIVAALSIYRDFITSQPTVVLGDFNSNVRWDADHPPDRNHSALVRQLTEFGLVSAYHAYFTEEQGEETRPTIYFQWKQARPYHIDYCFIPEGWVPRLSSVAIGDFGSWSDASDHRPLIVDVDPRSG